MKKHVPTPAAPTAAPTHGPDVAKLHAKVAVKLTKAESAKPAPVEHGPVNSAPKADGKSPAGKPQSVKPEPAKPSAPDPHAAPAASGDAGKKSKPEKKETKRKRLHRHSLQEYLEKAGYDKTDAWMRRIVHWSLGGMLTALSLAFIVYSLGASASSVLSGLLLIWTLGAAALWLIAWAGVYFFLDYQVYRRTKELEEVLPDFLQLASSNIAAGMPIDRALWYAIRPNFGVLAKEMEEVAKATMAGEDLEASLLRMTNRYDSVVLKRSINILIEGLHAGGEMADLLNKIALNIDEMKIMKKEMAASVTSYAIFITFASVAIAPVLFALATELLSIIIKITGSLDLTSSSSMITLAAPSADAVPNFKIFSILMLLVLTIFSAAIVSVIKRGNVIDGIKTMPLYAIIAIIIYFIALHVLHSAFGSII